MGILASIQLEGRFVRFVNNQWIVISDTEALQKIAHAIQYQIRIDQSQPPMIANNSSNDVITAPIHQFSFTLAVDETEMMKLELDGEKEDKQQQVRHSLQSSHTYTVKPLHGSNMGFSHHIATADQHHRTQAYNSDSAYQDKYPTLQPDVSQPLSPCTNDVPDQPNTSVPTVSDLIDNHHTFPPDPASFVNFLLDPSTQQKQRVVGDYTNQEFHSNANSHVDALDQQQQSYTMNEFTVHPNDNDLMDCNKSQSLSSLSSVAEIIFDRSFHPPPTLQQQHSLSSFSREVHDDSKIASQMCVCESCTAVTMNPYQYTCHSYEITTADNVQQQMQQLSAINSMSQKSIDHKNPSMTCPEVDTHTSPLLLLSSVSQTQTQLLPIEMSETKASTSMSFHMATTSMDKFVTAPTQLPPPFPERIITQPTTTDSPSPLTTTVITEYEI
jgi:hypothetical protein